MEGNPLCKQIDWDTNSELLAAWKEGRTGYPWIDAIMSQVGLLYTQFRTCFPVLVKMCCLPAGRQERVAILLLIHRSAAACAALHCAKPLRHPHTLHSCASGAGCTTWRATASRAF